MAGFHADNDEPQFAGNGGTEIHVAHRLVVDLDFQLVQLLIGSDYLSGQPRTGFHQGPNGGAYLLDGRFAHQDQLRTKGFEFGIKKSFHKGNVRLRWRKAQPKRPAT